MPTKLPDAKQSKDLVYLAIAIAVIVLVIIIAKNIGNFFKAGAQGLGLSNSDDKTDVNKVYNSGKSPLFSYTFPLMQAKAPAGAALLTVAQTASLVALLQTYRGILFDDGEKAVGLFAGLGTQFKVAWFAYQFQKQTGNELFNWIRKSDTLFAQGFNAQIVDDIIKTVAALPLYK